jgi:hypothetical protein
MQAVLVFVISELWVKRMGVGLLLEVGKWYCCIYLLGRRTHGTSAISKQQI